jgi:dipeptidyl aminopeptidase/acylaminoacyl peptidase
VVDAFGGRPHRLAKVGFVEDIRWSPDATMLSFISSRPGSAGAVDVIRADGTRLRRVHSGAGIVSWSPDSHSLVCLCAKAIETFNADGSGLRQLATRTEGTLGAASWSPDGSQIAYGRHCSPGLGADIFCDIAVMAADGSSKRTLVAHRATTRGGPDDGRPFWASADQLLITKWGFARGTLLVRSDMGLTTDFPTTGFRSDWAVLGADGLIGFVRPALSHPRRSEVEIVTVDGTVVERHLLPKGVDPDNPPPLWVS